MKLYKAYFLVLGLLTVLCAAAQEPLIAFPGAEGFGRFATGGRGGEIYHVTTLDDSGKGSFRDAVSGTGRIIENVGPVLPARRTLHRGRGGYGV